MMAADQGLWWKLWASALDDPDLDNLDIADFGRFCKLGAFVKRHGQAGVVAIRGPARALCTTFQVVDFDAFHVALQRLPSIKVRRDNGLVAGETVLTVAFDNWWKYQGDLSTPRVRRHRQVKRSRGEEKRREENPPLNPPEIDRHFRNGGGIPTRAGDLARAEAERIGRRIFGPAAEASASDRSAPPPRPGYAL
jgi:hypothetical protein